MGGNVRRLQRAVFRSRLVSISHVVGFPFSLQARGMGRSQSIFSLRKNHAGQRCLVVRVQQHNPRLASGFVRSGDMPQVRSRVDIYAVLRRRLPCTVRGHRFMVCRESSVPFGYVSMSFSTLFCFRLGYSRPIRFPAQDWAGRRLSQECTVCQQGAGIISDYCFFAPFILL